jgi:hypothetical protein
MEASEKPQLELGDEPGGTVRALGDRIVIEGLSVEDARAARLVRERSQAGTPGSKTIRDAIEIGARVLDSEETAVNVDYVRRELEAGLGELDSKLGETLQGSAEAIAEQIEDAFDGDDSVQEQLREIVAKNTREQLEAVARLLTAEDSTNPLVNVQKHFGKAMLEAEERNRTEVERLRDSHSKEARAMHGQVAELRKEISRLLEREDADRRVAEEVERGTAKGRSFEDMAHAMLAEIASNHGDAAHHTGDESSDAGGKMGDTVIEVGGATSAPLATIVFEAKNKRLPYNEVWPELNGCMAERDASYAVLVVAGEDKVPSRLEELTEYQGNKMVVVLDRNDPDPLALKLAYRYVRARVLAGGSSALEVDAAGVRDAAEEAAARLKRANRVRKSLTSVTNSAKAAGDEFDEMVKDVERCLTRIESLVAAAAADEGSE